MVINVHSLILTLISIKNKNIVDNKIGKLSIILAYISCGSHIVCNYTALYMPQYFIRPGAFISFETWNYESVSTW